MRPVVLFALMVLVGCSDDKSAPQEPLSSGDSASVVDTSAVADTDVDAGFAFDTSPDQPDTAGLSTISCDNPYQTHSVGSVDGKSVDTVTTGIIEWGASGDTRVELIPSGLLAMTKTGGVVPDAYNAKGHLLMPSAYPEPGVTFCVSDAVVWTDGPKRRRAVLRGLSRLGACGGATAPDLHICIADGLYDATKDPDAATAISCKPNRVHLVSGSVDKDLVWSGWGKTGGTPTSKSELGGFGDGGVFTFNVALTMTGGSEGNGSLWMVNPVEADPAQSVVCAANARVRWFDHHRRIDVVAPHTLGGCPKASVPGQLELCSAIP